VANLAIAVGREMGLSRTELDRLEKAALLHDVGKIGVPDAILRKPGPLTEDEWAEMRRHPAIGKNIIRDVPFLEDIAEIIYSHHERFDGGGYPRGLKGNEVPLGARIFSVVDAYDAMTSDRPYRKAGSPSAAVREIITHSGSQFDSEVVNVFLRVVEQRLGRQSQVAKQVSGHPIGV
jgi:putative nucleotidyltransferase with HDIG domain